MKLFRYHSRSKPCHSLLVRLTCDCKDTVIIPVLPNSDCCIESRTLFSVLKHRAPSSPIYLSEEIRKPCTLSQVFLLFSGGKSVLLVKEKVPSRSGFPASMYVVLKTRHVNPNIHVRRFIVHVRSPNLQATRPQLFIPARSNNRTEVTSQSYIAFFAILYSSTHAPIYLYMSSAGLLLSASTTPRARTLYIIGGGLSISPSPTPSAYDRSSDCDTIPKPYRRT